MKPFEKDRSVFDYGKNAKLPKKKPHKKNKTRQRQNKTRQRQNKTRKTQSKRKKKKRRE
jgi:hypothetical protein